MIKAVIFDCFGVITTDGLEAVIGEAEQKNPGVRALISEVIAQANRGEISVTESRTKVSRLLGVTPEEYSQEVRKHEHRNEALLAYIPTLRGQYKTALLSNVPGESLEKRFPKTELNTYFDKLFVSGDLGMAKPDEAIYRYAATELGVQLDECVFIDDRQHYLDPAQQLGMHTILFKNNEQFFNDIAGILSA